MQLFGLIKFAKTVNYNLSKNEVHWLVFVIQWIEKMHSEMLKFLCA